MPLSVPLLIGEAAARMWGVFWCPIFRSGVSLVLDVWVAPMEQVSLSHLYSLM
jgi:hypothetical protein